MYKFIATDYNQFVMIIADTLEEAEIKADQLLAGNIEIIAFI